MRKRNPDGASELPTCSCFRLITVDCGKPNKRGLFRPKPFSKHHDGGGLMLQAAPTSTKGVVTKRGCSDTRSTTASGSWGSAVRA